MISRAMLCRLGGLALAATWIVLCFLPVSVYAAEGNGLGPEHITPDMLRYEYGWDRALVGWLGAMQSSPRFGWFANLLGLWCLISMLRGRLPNPIAAVAAAILAATGLEPYSLGDWFDSHGTNSLTTMYYTVDVWAWSFSIPIAVLGLVYGLQIPPDPKDLLIEAPAENTN